jgi:hypothetical protein
MWNAKFVIGLDFGTESGRALLVDVATGRTAGSAVFRNDVVAAYRGIGLFPSIALQNARITNFLEVANDSGHKSS